MANNPYVNKVQLANGTTLMDITDTTAEVADVAEGKSFYLANGQRAVGTASNSSNVPTTDMEWIDVYSAWQAGYYYDPDNDYAYTQIPSTERSWGETETYIAVSCTPYANMIPVKSGEEYRYLNMPVHFDSKNAEIPSVVLFDTNKDAVIAYTRTYQDVYTEFTIPATAVWMAVIYANSQTYVLQKHVTKIHDKEAILDEIEAGYRAYSLTVPPTPNILTKGYICIGTDDTRSWETKDLHTMFTTANIPYYMAAVPEAAKACITNDPYKTNIDYMNLCVNAGGEIICHSANWITELNKNDFETMDQYFRKGKQELESYGFKVRGIFKAGGDGAIYDTADPAIDMWATHYFEFGDYFGSFPFNFNRTLLDDWETYTGLGTTIQNIVTNHSYGVFAFHYYNANAQLALDTILNALQGYTRGVDYEFVTPSQLYDLLMPSARPSGSSGSGSVTDVQVNGTSVVNAQGVANVNISGKIDKPSNPASGSFLVYNGTNWVAQSLSTWQGGNY